MRLNEKGKSKATDRLEKGTLMKKLLSAVYFAGMGIEIIVRVPHALHRRQIPVIDQRITRVERGLLAGLSFTMLVLPLLNTFTSWLDFADYRLSPKTKANAGGIGTLLLGAAVWLFWRSHRDLGTNWSPSLEIGARQKLTTQGVYRLIRHPMYASQGLYGLAQALLMQNWIAGSAGLLGFFAFYFFRVPREERMMLDHFGDAYREYCARTGRVVPRFHR